MLVLMNWWNYVQEHTGGDTQEKIARRVDISTPSVGRWQRGTPKPENVAAFARAYDRPVLEAFIAAGFLTEEEAKARIVIDKTVSPQSFSNEQLVNEIRRRLTLAASESVTFANEDFGDRTEYDLVADDADGHDHEDEDEGLQTDP